MPPLRRALARHLTHAALFGLACSVLALAPSLYMLQVYDRVLTSRSVETLVALSAIVVVTILAMLTIEAQRGRLMGAAARSLERELAPRVAAAMVRRGGTGPEGASMRDVQAIARFVSGPGLAAVMDAPWLPVFVAVLFLLHPAFAWAAIAGAALLFAFAAASERATHRLQETGLEQGRKAGALLDGAARGADAAISMAMLDRVVARWSTRADESSRALATAGSRAGDWSVASRAVRHLVQTGMLGLGAWLVIEGEITAGAMIASSILVGRALAPVELGVAGWRGIVEARDAWQRIAAAVGQDDDARRPRSLLPHPQGRLSVAGLTVSRASGARPILDGVAFDLSPGESLGVAGPSGAGKSTLARALAGALRPAAGTVRLDGARLEDWDPAQLGALMGFLPQQVELLPGTVAENISRFQPDRFEHVVAAARLAGVHELLLALPGGYAAPLGERGAPLSAGQARRVGLARALFGDPALVVLDEPSAQLDAAGLAALHTVLRTLRARRITTIVISHDPGLLHACDRLLVLRDGRVERFGLLEALRAADARRRAARHAPKPSSPPQPPAPPRAGDEPREQRS